METLSHSPELSKVSLEKKNAIQTAFDTISQRAGEGATPSQMLEVASKYLEEVKGDYRLEQAAAKLEDYFRLEVESEKELALRRKELEQFFPGIGDRLIAANDQHFNNENEEALAKKYNIAP